MEEDMDMVENQRDVASVSESAPTAAPKANLLSQEMSKLVRLGHIKTVVVKELIVFPYQPVQSLDTGSYL